MHILGVEPGQELVPQALDERQGVGVGEVEQRFVE
jgi:hypothetical protein